MPDLPEVTPTSLPQPVEAALAILTGGDLPDHACWLERLETGKVWQSRETWVGRPHDGHNFRGGKLVMGERTYVHGLGGLANWRMALDLKGDALRFVSAVGVDKAAGDRAGARFEVYVDGQKVVDTGPMCTKDSPKLISVDLRGVKKLVLSARHATVNYTNDMCDWGGAMILLDPAAAADKQPVEVDPPDGLLDQPPMAPGNYYLRFPWTLDGKPYPGQYSLFLPDDFQPGSGKKYPLMLFLHGKGEVGPMVDRVREYGTPQLVEGNPEFRKKCPFIVLAPQINGIMDMKEARDADYNVAILDAVCKTYPVDLDRIYVTGFSYGGTGTWRTAIEHPDRFAAAAPICGRAIDAKLVDPARVASQLRYLPIWAIVGEKDGDFAKGASYMTKLLMAAGTNIRLTIIPNKGHDIWDPYFGGSEFYQWLLSNTRGHPAPRIPSDADKFAPPPPATVPATQPAATTAIEPSKNAASTFKKAAI
jgi:dienelactone hydrolase